MTIYNLSLLRILEKSPGSINALRPFLLNEAEFLREPHRYFRHEGANQKRNYHRDKKGQNVAYYFGHCGFSYTAA